MLSFAIFGFSLDEIESIFKIIGITITALTVLWRWVWIPSSKLLKKIDSIEKHLPTLIKIAEEFKPNGGNSLKDAINRLESGLAHNRDRHRLLISNFGLASFETDKEGKYTWVSHNWEEVTEIDFRNAIGNGWINSIHPWDKAKVVGEWGEAVSQGRGFRAEYILSDKNATKVKAFANPILDMKKNIVGYVGVISIENPPNDNTP